MRRALKRKLAEFIRAQVAIASEPRFEGVLGELQSLREHVANVTEPRIEAVLAQLRNLQEQNERNTRSADNERGDMAETQRMVGVACARIENFIKLQKEHSAAMEQSVASLLPNRVRTIETI
jgi:hypothetical protein